MKKLVKVCALTFFSLSAAVICRAQESDVVKWSYHIESLGKSTKKVVMKASIKDGWHLYAQSQPKEAIANPTTIEYLPKSIVKGEKNAIEIGKKEKQVIEDLDIVQYYFANSVEFVQLLMPADKVEVKIKYMVCNDEQCLPESNYSVVIPLK